MKHRVLIVDDEPEILAALQTYLDLNGYEVSICPNGESALLKSRETQFHLALLDVNMPGMDGITLLRRLKAQQPSLQAVMITAYSTLEKSLASWDAGASDYILKPFTDMDEILRIIRLTSERVGRWQQAEQRSKGGISSERNSQN
jgi:DNA-binding response OmpR family regulator